jgi:ABC-type uncharacterized transport system permease subunit
MPDVPGIGQLALVAVAIAAFAVGGGVSAARLWSEKEGLRLIAKICLYLGICASAAALAWHAAARHRWLPLEDNFETLIWLALLLALFVAYTQRVHPLRGLDWFVMPIVVLFLAFAMIFGRTTPRQYANLSRLGVHTVSAFGGVVAFGVAAAAGAMYLIANRQLRHKRLTPSGRLGSLERLEHITRVAVTLGFALLTVALATGLVSAVNGKSILGPDWYRQPKVLLAFGAWVVYALVLHSPINPSFRGRKTAMLSVFGFVLMIGVLIAVQLMPGS